MQKVFFLITFRFVDAERAHHKREELDRDGVFVVVANVDHHLRIFEVTVRYVRLLVAVNVEFVGIQREIDARVTCDG